jgi:hypothetical protein
MLNNGELCIRACVSNAAIRLSSLEKSMNKSIVAAAALFAGAAIAAPAVGWSAADTETRLAQAGPDSHGMGGGMGPGRMGGFGGEQRGPGGWMHRMIQMSPQQRCEERLARRAGFIAYVVAKLNLTAEQKPLWDKLQGVLQANADKERQFCTAQKTDGQQTVLDRLNRGEQFMTIRLQNLQQAKPAVEQLYQALSPEQKAIADRPFRHL